MDVEAKATRSFMHTSGHYTRGRRYTVDMTDQGMVGLFKGGYLVAVDDPEADDGQVDSWGAGPVSGTGVVSDLVGHPQGKPRHRGKVDGDQVARASGPHHGDGTEADDATGAEGDQADA